MPDKQPLTDKARGGQAGGFGPSIWPQATLRLLICDDEPTFARFVQNVAEQPGYAVQVTTDRPALMHAYDTLKPSTIILDMVLPGMDGNELIRWLAEGRCFARLIMITGDTPNHAKHAKVLAECQGLRLVITLNKPIEGGKLNTALGSQASP